MSDSILIVGGRAGEVGGIGERDHGGWLGGWFRGMSSNPLHPLDQILLRKQRGAHMYILHVYWMYILCLYIFLEPCWHIYLGCPRLCWPVVRAGGRLGRTRRRRAKCRVNLLRWREEFVKRFLNCLPFDGHWGLAQDLLRGRSLSLKSSFD